MSAPLTDPTIIKILSSGDAANPKNASALEKYALEQQSYNVDANVALLKCYQMQPSLAKKEMIFLTIAKSLMALPSADATLALYLVDEEHLVDAEIAALIAVYRHLQKCEFTEAWAALKAVTATALGKKFLSKEGGAALKGFETALRKYAAQTILVAYQTIDARTALATLNLASNADLGRFLTTEMQWTGVVIGDDGMLALPATKDNSMKPAVIQESVTFEQLAKVLVQGR